jgi:hypothetical protein
LPRLAADETLARKGCAGNSMKEVTNRLRFLTGYPTNRFFK